MLLPSARKIPPALVLLLFFLALLGWQLCQGTSHEELPPPPPPPAPEQEPPVEQVEQRKPRIAVVTFTTQQQSYLHLSMKNKDHYARRHGYDFVADYEAHSSTGSPVWWKFDMVERLTKSGKYDWIWWVDFDTLITNTSIKITDIIDEELQKANNPDEVDIIFTHDCNGLNLGSFIARAHDRSLEFFHRAYELHDHPHQSFSEQDAMVQLLKEKPYKDRHIVAPQSQLNAYPKEIRCFENRDGQWKPGYFFIHFAGAWAHLEGEDATGQLMNQYEDQILWGEWEQFY
ncbi:galactosyl transferase GMA12 MNN10 family-domain-containing [Pyrenophora seminiperda CCB06]|uniref:Galactosyl transferase GMA12 MNN10 family-domain-containing n=1 Tax=Pyrenophora seminiperda CCB06 TaxID=1302712 RepID=A0A3M7LX22_9PLEO|nr:galactosyl transferase GMA12 MNN10 family-domain-containing [Pyrenophora seminiperda CCB06]